MLSEKCLIEYQALFPKDDCFFAEETGNLMISSYDGKNYIPPNNETDKEFMDRLQRSKITGKNLFYEEWKFFEYIDDSDCYY